MFGQNMYVIDTSAPVVEDIVLVTTELRNCQKENGKETARNDWIIETVLLEKPSLRVQIRIPGENV